MGKGENLFIDVVYVKQGCIQMNVSTSTIQISTSNPAASNINIEHTHVARQPYKVVFSSNFSKKFLIISLTN